MADEDDMHNSGGHQRLRRKSHVRAYLLTAVAVLLLLLVLPMSTQPLVRLKRESLDQILVGNPPQNGGYFCFEDNCRCHSKVADCSRNNGTLMFIPKIVKTKKRIRHLNFSYNQLRSIPTDDFLGNASNMNLLDLSNNELTFISPGAFRVFKSLQTLILSSNPLTFQDVTPVFPSFHLLNLKLVSMSLGPLPEGFFQNDSAPVLETLDLSDNKLGLLNISLLSCLTKLKTLKARGCQLLDQGVTSAPMPSLEELRLDNNTLLYLPETCEREKNISLFPGLRELGFSWNLVNSLPGSYCLPSLTLLDLSGTRITTFTTDMFNDGKFPNLTSLRLNNMQYVKKIENFAFRHPTLKTLVMMYTGVSFGIVSPLAFAGSLELAYLMFDHIQASDIPEEKFSLLFGSIPNLQNFYLKAGGIRTMTKKTFNQLSKLRTMHLDRNKLTELPEGAFDQLSNLTELVLSNNSLTTVSKNTFSPETIRRLQKLDLSGNRFHCDCSILWFQGWYLSSTGLFNDSYGMYSCDGDQQFPLSKLVLREQVCFFSQDVYKFTITIITLFLIIFTATLLVYGYIWHIRLLLYEAFRGSTNARYIRLRENHFDFDVFVSYAQEDLPWVKQHLLHELQDRLHLKLCIHERDFILGEHIVDNIVRCVRSSKKVLMVFSRAFVASQWCQFELNYCLRHVMEYDDSLIVTCINDMTALRPTNAMMAVLKMTTYIQWEDSPHAAASFWGRIQLALGDILDEVSGRPREGVETMM